MEGWFFSSEVFSSDNLESWGHNRERQVLEYGIVMMEISTKLHGSPEDGEKWEWKPS